MSDTADRLYERVLVLRCQAGDEDAFEELVARYSDRLRYYLKKMLQTTDEPDPPVTSAVEGAEKSECPCFPPKVRPIPPRS